MEVEMAENSEVILTENEETDKGNGKQKVVIMVGAPGSGKSTFCENVMRVSSRSWVRVCQDIIGNGKAGSKVQCINSAISALQDGKDVLIDRCNLDRDQRADFVKLGSPEVDVHAVVLDLPAQVCISRSVKRSGHEGNLQGGKAAAVVNRMLQKKEFPKLSEGFSRITFCHNDADFQACLSTYGTLGPSSDLPHGCFGQKSQDAKAQVGIMKYLKKVDAPSKVVPKENSIQKLSALQNAEKKGSDLENLDVTPASCDYSRKKEREQEGMEASSSRSDIPTLAFPSLSTADFQFDLEKASDIIVEKVGEFVNKLGRARLVLVDLSHRSKILSLVQDKAAKQNIDSSKFFTFVGDIVHLSTRGGLRCNVIANAANWRLKPGGGGVNAAIFSAAGPDLEVATKEQCKSLCPGNAVVVPLPSTCPLYIREGVTHIIHVLGPNMNPQRPNCLNNDYNEGCRILREAYRSLFEGFISISKSQLNSTVPNYENPVLDPPKGQHLGHGLENQSNNGEQKSKRDDGYPSNSSKKSRGFQDEVKVDINSKAGKRNSSMGMTEQGAKAWGSWAQALHHVAMHPEMHKIDVLEISEDIVVLKDLYPKAKKHVLVLARAQNLDRLADVHEEHLPLLRRMHSVGFKCTEKFLHEDASLTFRLGYHSAPSMRQLHLHVISQDFNSVHLKNKKHWNSFNTAFFRDSVDVIEEVSKDGKALLKDDESLLSMELRCNRCRSVHPNIPRLKSHINNCRSPFPSFLSQNGRLVSVTTDNMPRS